MQTFVKGAYRENARLHIKYEQEDETNEIFIVREEISYTIKGIDGKINEKVMLIPSEGEYFELCDYNVILINDDKTKYFDMNSLLEFPAEEGGFNMPFPSEFNLNNTKVILKIIAKTKLGRFIGWRMANPTFNLSLKVEVPNSYLLQKEHYFNTNKVHDFSTISEISLEINDWLLPNEGIVFEALKNDAPLNDTYAENEAEPLDNSNQTIQNQTREIDNLEGEIS